ncbi:glycosyl transferase [bacterium]|nr:glycosyl transferase [bacterium]
MKILYAIQGTGNGHLSRANDIIPILQRRAELDILVSGIQADVSIPFDIKYNLKGMSFIFGKKGGVDLWKTYKYLDLRNFINEIRTLPVEEYDLVINDFEAVSAWAAKLKSVPCIALSHQAAVAHKKSPKPAKTDLIGKTLLKYYAPSNYQYGFHFESYGRNIFGPVIRKQIKEMEVKDFGHYTVYLPSYGDKAIIEALSRIDSVYWEVFSKHTDRMYREGNVWIKPIENSSFIKSLASCTGVLCGAGFETPAEALYLGKKLMVIPMKAQYEQQCNAAALEAMGVPVLKDLKFRQTPIIEAWVKYAERISVNFPDSAESAVDTILDRYLIMREFKLIDQLA